MLTNERIDMLQILEARKNSNSKAILQEKIDGLNHKVNLDTILLDKYRKELSKLEEPEIEDDETEKDFETRLSDYKREKWGLNRSINCITDRLSDTKRAIKNLQSSPLPRCDYGSVAKKLLRNIFVQHDQILELINQIKSQKGDGKNV